MRHQSPSLVRISLLLIGSMIAGMVVATMLAGHVETQREVRFSPPEESLAAENP